MILSIRIEKKKYALIETCSVFSSGRRQQWMGLSAKGLERVAALFWLDATMLAPAGSFCRGQCTIFPCFLGVWLNFEYCAWHWHGLGLWIGGFAGCVWSLWVGAGSQELQVLCSSSFWSRILPDCISVVLWLQGAWGYSSGLCVLWRASVLLVVPLGNHQLPLTLPWAIASGQTFYSPCTAAAPQHG